jgi:hypothetical protein
MDKEEITETENLELRISEMRTQFQQSYDVFIKAHEELSRISFDPSTIITSSDNLDAFSLETKDINEIVGAGSVDLSVATLRSKVKPTVDGQPNTFPDVSKLLNIMSSLQVDIESLTENQKRFTKLTDDVNQEMSVFEKRMEESISQLDDLVVESLDGSEGSQHGDDEDDDDDDDEEETLGSESFSD